MVWDGDTLPLESIAFEMIMFGKTFKTLLLSIIFSLDIKPVVL